MLQSTVRHLSNRQVIVAAMFALSMSLATSTSEAAVMSFSSTRDTIGLAGIADSNFGGADFVQSGRSVAAPTRGTIGFNVSSLAGTLDTLVGNNYTFVSGITLRMFVQAFDMSATKTTQVFAISDANANWVEGTGGAGGALQAGTSTWNNKLHGSTPWAGSVGLGTPGVDYDPTLLSSQTFAVDPGANTQVDFVFSGSQAQFTALVKHWAEVANGGLLLVDPNENTMPGNFDRMRYWSREAANASFRPVLLLDLVQVPVPEPSTCLLLSIGLVAMMPVARRRSRGRAGV